jgi:2-phosphosulfolactate phosphatase
VTAARYLATRDVGDTGGAVVVVDVIRAFTTAAYALSAGAAAVYLVGSVAEALAFLDAHPGAWAMGEDHGHRPDGFALPNSPAMAAAADLGGRTVVQRTSAGTQGVVAAARTADRLWCTGLACASATAAAVRGSGLGAPTYVLTGWFTDRPGYEGTDDRLTAELVERARVGAPLDAEATAAAVAASDEAVRTLALGDGHVHPDDIVLATRVDAFDFAMEVERAPDGLRLVPRTP